MWFIPQDFPLTRVKNLSLLNDVLWSWQGFGWPHESCDTGNGPSELPWCGARQLSLYTPTKSSHWMQAAPWKEHDLGQSSSPQPRAISRQAWQLKPFRQQQVRSPSRRQGSLDGALPIPHLAIWTRFILTCSFPIELHTVCLGMWSLCYDYSACVYIACSMTAYLT